MFKHFGVGATLKDSTRFLDLGDPPLFLISGSVTQRLAMDLVDVLQVKTNPVDHVSTHARCIG